MFRTPVVRLTHFRLGMPAPSSRSKSPAKKATAAPAQVPASPSRSLRSKAGAAPPIPSPAIASSPEVEGQVPLTEPLNPESKSLTPAFSVPLPQLFTLISLLQGPRATACLRNASDRPMSRLDTTSSKRTNCTLYTDVRLQIYFAFEPGSDVVGHLCPKRKDPIWLS